MDDNTFCISLDDCINLHMSCIDGKCGIPKKAHRCIPHEVPCFTDFYCDEFSNRCKPTDWPPDLKTNSSLDCKPSEFYYPPSKENLLGPGRCMERVGPGRNCIVELNQCKEGYSCSHTELKCQKMCIVGIAKFGCYPGRDCIPFSDKSPLGVCETPALKCWSAPSGMGMKIPSIAGKEIRSKSSPGNSPRIATNATNDNLPKKGPNLAEEDLLMRVEPKS